MVQIIIITNNISGLWGLFSGPILGLETIMITKKLNENLCIGNGFYNNIIDNLKIQSQTFNKNLFFYDELEDNEYFIIDKIHNSIKFLSNNYKIIVIGENFLNIQYDYIISTKTFLEEVSLLSELKQSTVTTKTFLEEVSLLSELKQSTVTTKTFLEEVSLLSELKQSTVTTKTFLEEVSQLSELIGIIYNSIPNKPPLSSIPHSTSILNK